MREAIKEVQAKKIIQKEFKATHKDAKLSAESLIRKLQEYVEKPGDPSALDVVFLQTIARKIASICEELE